MKNILFVIAMKKEAKELAEKLELKKVDEEYNKLEVYRDKNITLLISGIGKQLTLINLTRYLENCTKEEKPDLIINIGYAGSTNSKIGEWVNVSKSYNYEWNIPGEQKYTVEGFENDKIKLLSQLEINNSISEKTKTLQKCNIKELPCYSAECFVTATNIKDDVVFDMELHSIYMICCIYGIDLISLKKVSDNLNLEDYYKNIDMKEVMELTSGLKFISYLLS